MNEDDWIALQREIALYGEAYVEDPTDADDLHMDIPKVDTPILVSREALEDSPRIADMLGAIYRKTIEDGLIKHSEFASLFHKEEAPMTDEAYLKACDAVLAAVVYMMDNRDDATLKRIQAALAPETDSRDLETWAKALTKKQIEERRDKKTEAFNYYHPSETKGTLSYPMTFTNYASNTSNTSWVERTG